MTQVEEVVAALETLMQDDQVPASVNSKLSSLMDELKSTKEFSLTLNKSICELEELSEDVNIPAFVRTQLWGVLSLLAALESKV